MKLRLTHFLFAALMLCPSLVLEAPAAGAPAAEEATDKNAARITGSENYIIVTGLHAPIAGDDGFDSMMALDAGLEIADSKALARAHAQMPRVRDALRRAVHSYLSSSYQAGTVPDLNILSVRLQRAADELFGKDVAEVTIAVAIIHKYN